MKEATLEAEKHASRSEPLAALLAEARTMLEQARAADAEWARVAAEAVAAVEAAGRLQLEEEAAVLALGMQHDALRLQEAQAQLGSSVVPPAAPVPHHPAHQQDVPIVERATVWITSISS
jgi:hypothetical protein